MILCFVIIAVSADPPLSNSSSGASAYAQSERQRDSARAVEIALSNPQSSDDLISADAMFHSLMLESVSEHERVHHRAITVRLDRADSLLDWEAHGNIGVYAGAETILAGVRHPLTGTDSTRLATLNARLERVRARVEAERVAAEARQKRERETALASMKRERDDFKEITWYQDRSHPRYANTNAFRIYIGEPKYGAPFLRLLLRYSGDNWLFVERFEILADGQRFTIDPGNHFAVERDNGAGDVWEWYDVMVGSEERRIIDAVANSTNTRIRYVGSQYYKDRTITASENAALRRVLAAHSALGGR